MDTSILVSAGIGTMVTVVIAIILAIAISFVTQCFFVEADPKISQIYEILPHFNCGACGYPGCMPYAEGIVNTKDVHTKCRPGGQKVAEQILQLIKN